MRICVFGAGAVGSHFAVRLALAGHDVSCVMRGAHLEAVKANALTLRVGNGEFKAKVRASIDSPEVMQIRETIWSKLLTNMSMSVLCLLTGQTARAVRDDPDLADIVPRLLDEANSIARSCFPEVKRVTRSGPAPDHKPSILQDYERGRPMEIDALVTAPAAFARVGRLSTPMLDLLAALAIRQARDKGLYQG